MLGSSVQSLACTFNLSVCQFLFLPPAFSLRDGWTTIQCCCFPFIVKSTLLRGINRNYLSFKSTSKRPSFVWVSNTSGIFSVPPLPPQYLRARLNVLLIRSVSNHAFSSHFCSALLPPCLGIDGERTVMKYQGLVLLSVIATSNFYPVFPSAFLLVQLMISLFYSLLFPSFVSLVGDPVLSSELRRG